MASSRKAEHGKALLNLPEALGRWWHRQWPDDSADCPRSVLVAYSGGADSTALLHAVVRSRKTATPINVPIRAVHFNHHLQEDANSWQNHCEHTCRTLGIPLTVVPLELPDDTENTARSARYDALKTLLRPDEVLMTAHHRDDQAETVLQHLLRGCGLTGLGGIRPVQSFAQGWLTRPLLNWPKQQLLDWLLAEGIPWVQDPSNRDPRYRRNFLRHRIMPAVQENWPQADKALSRVAEHTQGALDLLRHFYRHHGPARGQPLPLSFFNQLPPTAHGTWLALWLADNRLNLPDSTRIREFLAQCLNAGTDRAPQLDIGSQRIVRWRDALHLTENSAENLGEWTKNWDGLCPLKLPGSLGSLELTGLCGKDSRRFQVGFYRGGESIHLPGHAHRKRLKKLFQEQAIAPWQRRQLPLIFEAGSDTARKNLLAIGDRWLAEQAPFRRVLWHRPGNNSPVLEEKR